MYRFESRANWPAALSALTRILHAGVVVGEVKNKEPVERTKKNAP